jgi:hypothetical protein
MVVAKQIDDGCKLVCAKHDCPASAVVRQN